MHEAPDLASVGASGRPVIPACPGAEGPVRIRPVDPETVSFTCEHGDAAAVYHVRLRDGAAGLVHAFERPPRTGNVWKTCEALTRGGRMYTLVRHAADRYVVADVAGSRAIALPIRPEAGAAIDTVADFHADERGVVYLNDASGLSERHLVVACDWAGAVTWTVGLDEAFPGRSFYLWEVSLSALADGGFLVFVNGNARLAGGDDVPTAGLLRLGAGGALVEAFGFPWCPGLMPAAAGGDTVDGGGGFLLGDRPVLVAQLEASTVLRGRSGEPVVVTAPPVQPGAVELFGAADVGGRLVVGHGAYGLTVHELR